MNAPVNNYRADEIARTEAYADALWQRIEQESPATIRLSVGAMIERLIARLDDLDGDADFEPYLGGDAAWSSGDDREVDDDLEAGTGGGTGGARSCEGRDQDDEDDGTAEPILGAPENHPVPDRGMFFGRPVLSQARWAQGASRDAELDDSDLEDGGDTEPRLGWNEQGCPGRQTC